MKKLLSLFFALATCLLMNAAHFIIDGIGYNVANNGYALAVAYYDGYHKMDTIVIPEQAMVDGEYYPVVKVDAQAFKRCDEVRCILLPRTITELSWDAFSGCSGLTSISFDGVTTIGNNAFEGCSGLTEVTIPSSVQSMGSNVFLNCTSLEKLTYEPTNISSLSKTWLSGVSLKEMVIDENVKVLPQNLAYRQTSLKTVNIPESVTHINSAFIESGLTSIEIPKLVRSVYSAFESCHQLKSVKFNGDIGAIGYGAFCDCPSLTDIEIPGTVTTLAAHAFSGCISLKSLKLPPKLSSIGVRTLAETGLTSLMIPASIVQIYERSLGDNPYLTSIYCKRRNPLAINSDVFEGNYILDHIIDTDTLYVPHGCRDKYIAAEVWKDFGTIVEMPWGDVNWDNRVDVIDLNMITNAIIDPKSIDTPTDADLNYDGKVDILDVNILINLILGLQKTD